MFADLPPHSSVHFLSVAEARAMISFPTAVEPVNETMSTSGWSTSAWPASGPKPGTMFTTPGGKPASWNIDASSIAVEGVSSEGFRTTVLPAASAGPSFQIAIFRGKFQGVIAATTPTGSRIRRFWLNPGLERPSTGSVCSAAASFEK